MFLILNCLKYAFASQDPLSSALLKCSYNLLQRIVKMTPSEDGQLNIAFEVSPQKEKLYHEKVTLVDAKDSNKKCVVITLHCRVLGKFAHFSALQRMLMHVLICFSKGKGKGTPMLKNGIRTIELMPDPDASETNSDWQGF